MLTEIEAKLEALLNSQTVPMQKVAYGLVPESQELNVWNYFVFRRLKTKKAGNVKGTFNDYYTVHIVHENAIPEGYVDVVVNKVLEINKIKLADVDIQYDYTRKLTTDIVVEIATITFAKGRIS